MKKTDKEIGFVFLHGAGLGGWIWSGVIEKLSAPCLALDLPGRLVESSERLSLNENRDYVLEKIQEFECKKILLVAHSVSGALALSLIERLPDSIHSLVMVGAGVPAPGKSYAHSLPLISRLFLKTLYFFKPNGLLPPPGLVQKALCTDLSINDTKQVLDNLVVEHPGLFLDPVPDSALPHDLRRVYIILDKDQSDLKPALQKRMAATLEATIVHHLPTGHLPMLSVPRGLVELLKEELEEPVGKEVNISGEINEKVKNK